MTLNHSLDLGLDGLGSAALQSATAAIAQRMMFTTASGAVTLGV
jgi:uncharacterized ferredoxin-like protein